LLKVESSGPLKGTQETVVASLDDRKIDWNFDTFEKVVSEMKSSKTTVGSIMAAMIYQIETENKKSSKN
jgi:hypothetical protein